jgi:hypothetical protein
MRGGEHPCLAKTRGALDDGHATNPGLNALQKARDQLQLLVPASDLERIPGTAHFSAPLADL